MHSDSDLPATLADQIGRRVREERDRLDLRQDELALAAGVSTRVVHQVENGKATSRLDSLAAVLDALGLTLVVEDSSADPVIASGDR